MEAIAVAPNKKNTIIFDTNVIPIYPVRYAYANFFEKDLEKASEPPELKTFIGANSLKKSKGYVIRLLREGWIYIKEENGNNGHFHIFKYTKIEKGGTVAERFKKYLFRNRVDTRGGLIEDTSGELKDGYPYVFVRKGAKKISIAYSEHEWSNEVIARINGSAEERKSCMQLVDLSLEEDAHSMKGTQDNLEKLIEDYKIRKDRLLRIKSGKDTGIKDISLDILTTETSYELDPKQIAEELQKKQILGNKARIIALHDPVGRQKEIVEAHAKLAMWEKDYSSQNMYPFTIGQMVNDFLESKDKDTKKIAVDAINKTEFDEHWKGMRDQFKLFHDRQKQFAKIYKDFMLGDGKVGSLDTYFKKFFCQKPKDVNKELQRLCQVSADMFAGMMASPSAIEAMEEIAGDESDNNAYKITLHTIRLIITTPQKGFGWDNATKKTLDGFIVHVGPMWAKMVSLVNNGIAAGKKGANKFTTSSIKFMANTFIPLIEKFYGLDVDVKNGVSVSNDELAKILANAIDEGTSGKPKTQIDRNLSRIESKALQRLEKGSKLFDWADELRKNPPKLFKISNIKVSSGARGQFKFLQAHGQTIAIGVETSFSGISAYFNIKTIWDVKNQIDFSNGDILSQRHAAYNFVKVTAAVSSLTIDMITLYRTGVMVTGKISSTMPLARSIAPALNSHAANMSRFLGTAAVTKFIAVANVAACISSTWDSIRSFSRGDTGEATGHALMALGSGILAAQSIAVLAGAAAATGPVGVIAVVVGLIIIGIGLLLVYLFTKSPLERLLENCFWGKSDNYAFWFNDNERPKIADRLREAQRVNVEEGIQQYFQMELQEFMNQFYMPQLEIKTPGLLTTKGKYTYVFKLPGFIVGQSQIIGGLAMKAQDGGYYDFFSDIVDGMKETKKYKGIPINNGVATVEITVDLPTKGKLYWAYIPKPNLMVPIRFLTPDGIKLNKPFGMIDGEPA